jgi:hypothetical protein
MAMPDVYTPDSVGPIRDINARRVCTLSGIAAAQDQLVSFRKLRDGLDMTIRELDGQQREDRMIHKALLVTRFTKATCDAFLGMAAGFAKVLLPKGAGKAAEFVNNVYGTATPIAEAVGTSVAGGTVDLVKTVAATAKQSASFVENDGYQIVIKTTAVKAEIINSAMNGDREGVVKTAATYVYDLHAKIGDMMGAKKVAVFAEIAKQTFEYNEQIGKAFDEMLESSERSEEQFRMLKATISSQAKRLSEKINALEEFIQSCEPETPRVLG